MKATPRLTNAFTLVELLIVLAIVGVLIAMLLPALSEARLQARRLHGASNMRQMVLGFRSYAFDSKGYLPNSVRHTSGFFPIYMLLSGYGPTVDMRKIGLAYGITPATAHPVMGAPPTSNPPNTLATVIGMSYYYFPGYSMSTYPAASAKVTAPVRVDLAKSGQEMMQDHLARWTTMPIFYAIQTTTPQAVLVAHPDNPSACYTQSSSVPLGAYCGFYDGAVVFKRYQEFKWAQYYPTAEVAHVQPD